MITITKPTYKCEHCLKFYQYPKNCEKHEIKCSKNPANQRACGDCKHCVKKEGIASVMHEHLGHEVDVPKESFYCNSKAVYLHPPKIEHSSATPFNFEGFENQQMPLECSKFERIFYS